MDNTFYFAFSFFLFAPVATVEFLNLYLIKEFLYLTYKCVVMQVHFFFYYHSNVLV